jgi:hypothetical protein
VRTFFGLDHEYSENVYEQMFAMVFHGKLSLIEAYNLPVGLRTWFLGRLKREFEEEKERYEEASRRANS